MLFTESPRFATADLSSIEVFTSGGLYISEQLRRKVQSKLPHGKVFAAYGITEVGGIVAETDLSCGVSSSVGKPTVNTQIKILIDDGTTANLNEIGEILVRKPAAFLGYVGSNHAPVHDTEGWYHTGDMGYIDDKYEIYVVGQRSFVIKSFYNEVHPKEIEDIIEDLPGVRMVCVVGAPDRAPSPEIEVPCALVVKYPSVSIQEEEIIAATNHLPPFKRLRDVFFVDSLPVTQSGKVQRRFAMEMAEKLKFSGKAQTLMDI